MSYFMEDPNMEQPLPGENPDVGMTQQYSKEEANYRAATSRGRSCGFCAHFQPQSDQSLGAGTCDLVGGPIQPNGVSDLFAPRQGLGGLLGEA